MPDSRRADLESRRRIREDLLTNILVEAGAGSGKTQMLAERMAAGVARGVYRIDQMAAVTFTRKAASELRGRFHKALEDRLAPVTRDGRCGARPRRAGQSGTVLRRHDPLVLRPFAARAAGRVRRLAWLHGARRGPGSRVEEARLARLHHRGALPALPPCSSSSIPRQARRPGRCVPDGVRERGRGLPGGHGDAPGRDARVHGTRDLLGRASEASAGVHRADTTCKVQKAARKFRARLRVWRSTAAGSLAALLGTWDIDSKITQNRWGDTSGEEAFQGAD